MIIFKNLMVCCLTLLVIISKEHRTSGQYRQAIRSGRRNAGYQQQFLRRSADSCITSLGSQGTCIPLKSCAEALHYLRYYRIQPNICSADSRFNPRVCCAASGGARPVVASRPGPRDTKPQAVNAQRISERKCYEQHSVANGRSFQTTIVGGTKTYGGEFSYMAAIGWTKAGGGYDFKCGGVLITKQFVLTAGHCCNLGGAAPSVTLTGGYSLTSGQGTTISIASVHPHPEYDARYHYSDIGLLRLRDFAPQSPACLWQNHNIQSNAIAIGYGTTSFAGRFSTDLLKITLRTFTHNECLPYFKPNTLIPYGLASSHLCAGSPGQGKDTCQGDSGGPLIVNQGVNNQQIPFVIGITSFGQNCGGSAPGVYTRVSSFLPWIESVVWGASSRVRYRG